MVGGDGREVGGAVLLEELANLLALLAVLVEQWVLRCNGWPSATRGDLLRWLWWET